MFHHNPADSRLIRPQWLVKTPLIQFNKPVGRGTFRGLLRVSAEPLVNKTKYDLRRKKPKNFRSTKREVPDT
jgi:hypothetical protein